MNAQQKETFTTWHPEAYEFTELEPMLQQEWLNFKVTVSEN